MNHRPSDGCDSAMIDLETFGLGPNAAVVQIGVRLFSSTVGKLGPGIELNVDLVSSLLLGGETDDSTVRWWRERGGLSSAGPALNMRSALVKLKAFFAQGAAVERVWAQGPSFDVAILDGYYKRAALDAPWTYKAGRDTRTVYDLARERGWDKPVEEVAHTALADADQQITHLLSALSCVRGETIKGK